MPSRTDGMDEGYYDILGIPHTATEADIKKAYKKLALKWHPDKNPSDKEDAENRFKEVAEAYEILSDKSQRNLYDRYGKDGLNNNTGSNFHQNFNFGAGFSTDFRHRTSEDNCHFRDPFDVFRDFFGGCDPFEDLFSRHGGFGPHDSFFSDPFANSFSDQFSDHSQSSRHRHQQSIDRITGPGFGFGSFFTPDSFVSPFGTSTFANANFGGLMASNFKSTSTSTKIINGKKVVKKKVLDNGVETVTVTEDGLLTLKTINGETQALGY